MLDITYEAVPDLTPGQVVDVTEDRGQLRVRLDQDAPLLCVLERLNVEIAELLATGHWFQLWRDEIISSATPGCPLCIRFIPLRLDDDPVVLFEGRGILKYYVDPGIDVRHFAASITRVVRSLLDGGQWFQMYAGEIIDHSPEPVIKV